MERAGAATGRIIGDYQTAELLGRGTMGAVYRAHSVTNPELIVAIKRVASLGSDDDHARLRREADTMAQLAHPNIVRILEVIDDGSDLALVMEYAPGGSLSHRLTDGVLTPKEVVEVLAPIADALAVAHARGVIHRDVKPSNILFSADARPLLADFGIALASGQASLTGTGTALGTAAYLAPELVRADQPTVASDIYALGIVAYQALVGRPPYQAANPLAVVVAADMGVHARLDATVVGTVADVVERAMDRNVENRFASMDTFAAALREATVLDASAEKTRVRPAPDSSDQTTIFGPVGLAPTRPPSNSDALLAPKRPPGGRRRLLVGALMLALAAGVTVLAVSLRTDGPDARVAARPYAHPVCDPATTVQCVGGITRTGKGVRVAFRGAEEVSYEFGRAGDIPMVANWFCGPKETLAVYRPSSGVLYYFDRWPDPTEPAPIAYADATGQVDAKPTIGFRNDDTCADVRLASGPGEATWFEPAVQPGRLSVLSRRS